MGCIEKLAFLMSTDPGFCRAIEVSPHEALASRGLDLLPGEWLSVLKLRRSLGLAPHQLDILLQIINYPEHWGGTPVPTPS